LTDIPRARLKNQAVAEPKSTVRELVAWMGAIQAQDLPMAKWAMGLRTSSATVQAVDAAIRAGEVIRTHVLRPTWHFVSADDVYWMLELTAVRIRASMGARYRHLGITPEMLATTNRIIERMLRDRDGVTRRALVAEFEKAGIRDEDNRAAHLLASAELDGLICSGPSGGAQQSYTLLAAKVPKKKSLSKEEALATLAARYFTSHGPATLKDFIWWSGLRVEEARRGLEAAKSRLVSETIGDATYWFSSSFRGPKSGRDAVYLLPAYDEFLISYADRTAALPPGQWSGIVSSNGVFRPVLVIDGRVAGIWRRVNNGATVTVEIQPLTKWGKAEDALIAKAAQRYESFLGKGVQVRIGQ
jgi:hypothetical protein